MAFDDFDLKTAVQKFGLTEDWNTDLFVVEDADAAPCDTLLMS